MVVRAVLRIDTLHCKVLSMSESFDISDRIGTAPRDAVRRARPVVIPDFKLSSKTALTVLAFSGVVGSVGDLLLHDGITGIGFPVWIAIASVALVALLWRLERAPSREPLLWLGTAILFAIGVAWRESDTLQFFDHVTSIIALLMAVVTMRDGSSGLVASRMRDTVAAFASTVRASVLGLLPLAFGEALVTSTNRKNDRSTRYARTMLISAAVVLVFGALLRSADPIFASLTSLDGLDAEAIARHVLFIVVLTSLAAGAARSALLPSLVPRDGSSWAESQLEQSDVTTALITLNVLFGAFVLAQLGWFFGGEAFLHARTGLTAAEYARKGFFQTVFIVALVLPLLVAARASLPSGRSTDRRFASLAFPVVLQLGAMIVSAVSRMRLYVNYFGLSTDRFNTLVFLGWLSIVLVWFSLTVLRGRGQPFLAGAVISGLTVLAALNVAMPDVVVARVNLARASHGSPVDLSYLASLSGEAIPLAVRAVIQHPAAPIKAAPKDLDRQDHCGAIYKLLRRWRPGTDADALSNSLATWRTWNAGEHVAVAAVAAQDIALLKMQTICNSRT
jgi:hypothetical protein